MPKHGNKDDKELKDGQALRVPLMLMDGVQRSVYQQSQTDAAVRATQDAMRKEARSEASNHRPGYRLSVKMTTDAAARDALQDVYDQYESELTNAWRKAPVAGPITRRRMNHWIPRNSTVIQRKQRTELMMGVLVINGEANDNLFHKKGGTGFPAHPCSALGRGRCTRILIH